MITIERAIEGISINGKEMLLDEHGKPQLFASKSAAMDCLRKNGCEGMNEEELEDGFFFEEYIENGVPKV